ncbi:hypothetical protein EYR41_004883 [Orbilia oligospora]|uniref:Uncharacterized protein n=1 Tax=Orbilia oligospora TaxID=2813651 RepID=A0A7C8K6M5_ORBOL|nr:hypothetical protein TWF751_010793 [Orbilia oligospora]TGJ68798.1 hypothetical protein EYR41_004883 [Orbilia oligospora]
MVQDNPPNHQSKSKATVPRKRAPNCRTSKMLFESAKELIRVFELTEDDLAVLQVPSQFSDLPYAQGEFELRKCLTAYNVYHGVEYRGIGEEELRILLIREFNAKAVKAEKAANRASKKAAKNKDMTGFVELMDSESLDQDMGIDPALENDKAFGPEERATISSINNGRPLPPPLMAELKARILENLKISAQYKAYPFKRKRNSGNGLSPKGSRSRVQKKYKYSNQAKGSTGASVKHGVHQPLNEIEAEDYFGLAPKTVQMPYNVPMFPLQRAEMQAYDTSDGTCPSYELGQPVDLATLDLNLHYLGLVPDTNGPALYGNGKGAMQLPPYHKTTASSMSSENSDLWSCYTSPSALNLSPKTLELSQMASQSLRPGQLQDASTLIQQDGHPLFQSQGMWTPLPPDNYQCYYLDGYESIYTNPDGLSSEVLLRQGANLPMYTAAGELIQPSQSFTELLSGPVDIMQARFQDNLALYNYGGLNAGGSSRVPPVQAQDRNGRPSLEQSDQAKFNQQQLNCSYKWANETPRLV